MAYLLIAGLAFALGFGLGWFRGVPGIKLEWEGWIPKIVKE